MLFTVGCVSMCMPVCVHSASHPLEAPTPISGLVYVSPGASWVTDVCYPTPSELAQCDSQCQRGASHRPACLCEPQGVGGGWDSTGPVLSHKSLTWHSLAGEQTAQRHDLWEEISAASGVLALTGCQASRTPREEMNECARQSTLPAWVSACLFFLLFVCLARELVKTCINQWIQNVPFGLCLVKVITKFLDFKRQRPAMAWAIKKANAWVAGAVALIICFHHWICGCIVPAFCTFPSLVVILPSSQVMQLFIFHRLEQWPRLFFWDVCFLVQDENPHP